ncbi:MAG TPA: efflux RND transporter permease subunit, partial [Candidatus Goldiibacteriota bacterium]|nr:efflux RND transporter permease subunit [Candidatus Goldiibacteriota bacterium]
MLGFFTRQRVFSILASIFFVVAGVGSFIISPKESLPEIKLGIIVISTIYPNAAPQEVEKLVTTPLEDAVKNIKGIKETSSSSSDSVSVIVVSLKPDIKDTATILNDIKAAVDKVSTLPENSEKPEVTEITTDEFPVINVQLSGGSGYGELREAAKKFEEKLKAIKGVSGVRKTGFLDRAIWVETDLKKAENYGLTVFSAINALKNANLSIPAGNRKIDGSEYTIRAMAELKDSEGVKNVIIRSNEAGRYVKVGDIAKVADGFKEPAALVKADFEPAIVLTVLKASGTDSISVSKAA